MKQARRAVPGPGACVGQEVADDVGEPVGEQHRSSRRRGPPRRRRCARPRRRRRANGFSSRSALPAAAAATARSGCAAGATASATASTRSSMASNDANAGTSCVAATSSAWAAVRDQTPASAVSGPAASNGAWTARAHGPAPASPTRTRCVVHPARSCPFGAGRSGPAPHGCPSPRSPGVSLILPAPAPAGRAARAALRTVVAHRGGRVRRSRQRDLRVTGPGAARATRRVAPRCRPEPG